MDRVARRNSLVGNSKGERKRAGGYVHMCVCLGEENGIEPSGKCLSLSLSLSIALSHLRGICAILDMSVRVLGDTCACIE